MANSTETADVQPVFHPFRYPKHNEQGRGNKGQIWGGECNRTRCDCQGATWFNLSTRAYECENHAMATNQHPMPSMGPTCVPVDRQLTLEEMDALSKAPNALSVTA